MPFCPQCASEYIEGTAVCPDCLVPLVVRFVQEHECQCATSFVLLHTFPNIVYAEMVKGTSEEKGSACLLKSDMLTAAYGSMGGGVAARVRLHVPQDRVKESNEVMNQMLDHI